ncbi:hypothetical protein BTR14_20535 [Rhizobium rhizosphaerae]|uniref:Uncharacterized protein n=1 Tax=Xaviernesmea rhizosphaerae TaxID=1672749 RepID=A0ABX3P7Y6_9HYPH|nr:hypothetical protein [Xaviernesmea rhizosphaerae]OQP84192.1 hypothetical protein BTR14_20535 [Xaviernesmea rhizosphaerae]
MAITFSALGRTLQQITVDVLPEHAAAEMARFAKAEVRRLIASNQASPSYDRWVNGVHGAPEEAVKLPGSIYYVFSTWKQVITETLFELKRRAPVKSGLYAGSIIVLANGQRVENYEDIPSSATVMILPTVPYSRRLEVSKDGKKQRKTVDRARATMATRFDHSYDFETKFLNLGPGIAPGAPYHLKGSQGKRKDRQAGEPITYPAIAIYRKGG